MHLYNLWWLLMYMSLYKLTLSTCAPNRTAFMSRSFILKIIFRNTQCFYTLISKKASEIAYYINLYVCHFGEPGIFQCDNGREFKGALLIFLKNYGIKLISSRPQTPRIQELVQQANTVVKNKITLWKAEHGTGTWANSLTEIY